MEALETLYQLFSQCSEVTTDSRQCPTDSLFIALKGANFNGNKFAILALEKGCKYAFVDEQETVSAQLDELKLRDEEAYQTFSKRLILVEDGLSTLQQLAHYHRQQLGTHIIGITGTNGKTTTKELVAAVLSTKYNLLFTQGNLNNQIGVPLTLLRLTENHNLAVVEMGASHPGDIKELVDIAEPDYGLITNVGRAHLEGFGSFDGVVRTKGELYDYLRTKGATVFVNANNTHLTQMLKGLNPVYYGTTDNLYISGKVTACNPFLSYEWKALNESPVQEVETHLIGNYNIDNVLAASAIGIYFGVEPEDISKAIANYQPSNSRSQLKETAKNKLIIDAYNANPTSMQASLQNFAQMNAPKKMVILGDMKELGPTSRAEHKDIASFVTKMSIDRTLFVGEEFTKALPQGAEVYPDANAVIELLKKENPEGFTILIKGSNSMKLNSVVAYL